MSEVIQDVVDLLGQIENDSSIPKNIRARVRNAINILEEKNEKALVIKTDKAIEELGAITDSSNMPSYTRTQIWHILSLLESDK